MLILIVNMCLKVVWGPMDDAGTEGNVGDAGVVGGWGVHFSFDKSADIPVAEFVGRGFDDGNTGILCVIQTS